MSTTLVSLSEVQQVNLEFRIDPAEWQGSYDRLAIYRSRLGADGPYAPLTGVFWRPASTSDIIEGPSAELGRSVAVVGKTLDVYVNNGQYVLSHTFTGVDPLTYADCAGQLTTALSPLAEAWVTSTGSLVVATITAGNSSAILVTGEAAPLLGLEYNTTFYGRAQDLSLRSSVQSYVFTDVYGDSNCFYKTRFYNNTIGAYSEYSAPVSSRSLLGVASSLVAVGYLQVTDAGGRAQSNVRVSVVREASTTGTGTVLTTNTPITKLTDANGYVEFALLKGLKVTVLVSDVGLVRDIVVPDAARFSLLDTGIGKDDSFDVRRIDIAYGERRDL